MPLAAASVSRNMLSQAVYGLSKTQQGALLEAALRPRMTERHVWIES